MSGCAAPVADPTAAFLAHENQVSRACLSSQQSIPFSAKFIVNPKTLLSPFTELANCYTPQMDAVLAITNTPHAPAARAYSEFLLRLAKANDRGIITPEVAQAHYYQGSALYMRAINDRAGQVSEANRKEFFSRMSAFFGAVSATIVEQDRQRALNRPVNCFSTGVYVRNGVTCM